MLKMSFRDILGKSKGPWMWNSSICQFVLKDEKMSQQFFTTVSTNKKNMDMYTETQL